MNILIEDLLNNKESRVAINDRDEAMVIGDIDMPVLSSASIASSLSNLQNSNPFPFLESISFCLPSVGANNTKLNRDIRA